MLIGAAALVALGLIFCVIALLPPKAKPDAVSYQIAGIGSRPAPPGQPPPAAAPAPQTLLTGSFKITIGSRLKGQRVEFKKVAFFLEGGKQLMEVPVAQLTRQLTTRSKVGDKEVVGQNAEVVTGSLFLWPLEDGTVSFGVVSPKSIDIKAGQKVYAEVKGKSGVRSFTIKMPVKETQGFGF